MFLSKELQLLNYSLNSTPEMGKGRLLTGEVVDVPKTREFKDLKELKLALLVDDKLSALNKENQFEDGEIDFSTEEKAFLLKLIDRPWNKADGRVYISLLEKLS